MKHFVALRANMLPLSVGLPVSHTDIWKRPVFHLTRVDGSLLTMFEEVCIKLWVDVMAQSSR